MLSKDLESKFANLNYEILYVYAIEIRVKIKLILRLSCSQPQVLLIVGAEVVTTSGVQETHASKPCLYLYHLGMVCILH